MRVRIDGPLLATIATLLGWAGGAASSAAAAEAVASASVQPVARHPLAPALALAKEVEATTTKIHDYTATFLKRERIGDKLAPENVMYVKIRHKPFGVYVLWLAPASMKGDEAIYVEGRNDGKVRAHATGIKGRLVRTISLDPDGTLAMKDAHYPITELGVLNLCRRIKEVVEKDMQHDECEVTFDRHAKLGDRECISVKAMHPVRRDYFLYDMAKVYVDKQLKIALHYESYDWPKKEGGEPELIEVYEYRDLKLNVGLKDSDFDIKNPEYHFP